MAKRDCLITENYATGAYQKKPANDTKPPPAMLEEDAIKLYNFLLEYHDIEIKTALILDLSTGIRKGELCGLRWPKVDFKASCFEVDNQLTTVQGLGVVEKTPKTKDSERTIYVAEDMLEMLRAYKLWQEQRYRDLGDQRIVTDYVFTGARGQRIHPCKINAWLNKVLKEVGLGHYSVHSVRATNTTLELIASGNIYEVSKRKGHSRTEVTEKHYARVNKTGNKKVAADLSRYLKENRTADKEPPPMPPETPAPSTPTQISPSDYVPSELLS